MADEKNIIVSVTWIVKKRKYVKSMNLPDDLSGYPVCVKKNVIAENVPYKDMFITAEHALYFNQNVCAS